MNLVKKYSKKMPKYLEWKRFYVNDLPIIVGICADIRQISLENQLNKSQVKAISKGIKNIHTSILRYCKYNKIRKFSQK